MESYRLRKLWAAQDRLNAIEDEQRGNFHGETARRPGNIEKVSLTEEQLQQTQALDSQKGQARRALQPVWEEIRR